MEFICFSLWQRFWKVNDHVIFFTPAAMYWPKFRIMSNWMNFRENPIWPDWILLSWTSSFVCLQHLYSCALSNMIRRFFFKNKITLQVLIGRGGCIRHLKLWDLQFTGEISHMMTYHRTQNPQRTTNKFVCFPGVNPLHGNIQVFRTRLITLASTGTVATQDAKKCYCNIMCETNFTFVLESKVICK